jgi:hypothetical protein
MISPWFGDTLAHVATRIALRVGPPLAAMAWMKELARTRAPIRTIEEARSMARRLGGRGTCLSRAICIGAHCPETEVVIGVAPRCANGGEGGALLGELGVDAHAWLEWHGEPLLGDSSPWLEIARLPCQHEPPKHRSESVLRSGSLVRFLLRSMFTSNRVGEMPAKKSYGHARSERPLRPGL